MKGERWRERERERERERKIVCAYERKRERHTEIETLSTTHEISFLKKITYLCHDMIYKHEISDMKICNVRNFFSNWGYTSEYETQEWMGDKDIIPDSMPNTPERKVAMCIPQDTVLWSTVFSTCSIYEYFHHIWLIMKEIEVEMSWDFEHILFKYLWLNEDHLGQKADNF